MNPQKSIKSLLQGFASICLVMAMGISYVAFGATTTLTTTVASGELTVDIVDADGATVPSPGVSMSGTTFSNSSTTTSTGTLGVAAQKIRVTNFTTSAEWTLSIAASAPTALWSDSGSNTFDFNDGPAGTDNDGLTDDDSVGGQLTINPSGGSIAGVGGTSTDNISKGSNTAFSEGTIDSITLLTAEEGAVAPGEWDFTGISLSQIIPQSQAIAEYTLALTITVL